MTLWCVRLEGPDDLIAQSDREAADAYAEQHHAMVKRLIACNPGVEDDGITEASMRAIVEPWPWSAEAHAKALMETQDAN